MYFFSLNAAQLNFTLVEFVKTKFMDLMIFSLSPFFLKRAYFCFSIFLTFDKPVTKIFEFSDLIERYFPRKRRRGKNPSFLSFALRDFLWLFFSHTEKRNNALCTVIKTAAQRKEVILPPTLQSLAELDIIISSSLELDFLSCYYRCK